jgi:hypothetical protein
VSVLSALRIFRASLALNIDLLMAKYLILPGLRLKLTDFFVRLSCEETLLEYVLGYQLQSSIADF